METSRSTEKPKPAGPPMNGQGREETGRAQDPNIESFVQVSGPGGHSRPWTGPRRRAGAPKRRKEPGWKGER